MRWFTRSVGTVAVVCAALLIACMIFIFSLVLDEFETYRDEQAQFRPFIYRDLEVIPSEVCVGDLIQLEIDFTLDPDYELKEGDFYRYRSYWKNTETGQIVTTDVGRYDLRMLSQSEVTSPLLRTAPTTPGPWRFFNEGHFEGFVNETPREQYVLMRADDVTSVDPAERCPNQGDDR